MGNPRSLEDLFSRLTDETALREQYGDGVTDFSLAIGRIVADAGIGAVEFDAPKEGEIRLTEYDSMSGRSGRMWFGGGAITRRLVAGTVELAFVAGREPTKSRVQVSQFNERHSNVERQVTFRQDTDRQIHKNYGTPPWGMLNLGPGYSRDLSSRESDNLVAAFSEEDFGFSALSRHLEPTWRERRLLKKSAKELAKISDEYKRGMEEIRRSEREGWRIASQTFLD